MSENENCQGKHPDPALESLRSAAQNEVFDAIDRLSSEQELDVPHLIVCGNQSSGKISVLEAISHFDFPASSGTTTKFVTKIVLRRAKDVKYAACIVPGPGTSPEVGEHLRAFRSDFSGPADFANVLAQATSLVGSHLQQGWMFCKHYLQVEISGPDQPHLTLVDLPGLIYSTGRRDAESDIQQIRDIVRSYMRAPTSIILAVTSCENDLDTQAVFDMALSADPEGQRTIGILTKPDLKDPGTEHEIVKIVKNEGNYKFDLGWHILRNRSASSNGCSWKERDDIERKFFTDHLIWSELPESLRGIESLRRKLSEVLFRTIARSLPRLIQQLDGTIERATFTLNQLGSPRPELDQQGRFLHGICSKLMQIVDQGIDGHYHNSGFFGDSSTPEGKATRLRAKIRSLDSGFEQQLNEHGEQIHIMPGNQTYCDRHRREVFITDIAFTARSAICVTRDMALESIARHITENRGCELDGDAPSTTAADIFKILSTPWENLARVHIRACAVAAQEFFSLALKYVAPKHNAQAILEQVVARKLIACNSEANAKVQELISPFRRSFLMTKRPYVRSSLVPSFEFSRDRAAAEVALSKAESYYKAVQYTYIDNIIALASENCIIEPMRNMFTSEFVHDLGPELVAKLGSEPDSVVREREHTTRKLSIYREVLQVCLKHATTNSGKLEEGEASDITSTLTGRAVTATGLGTMILEHGYSESSDRREHKHGLSRTLTRSISTSSTGSAWEPGSARGQYGFGRDSRAVSIPSTPSRNGVPSGSDNSEAFSGHDSSNHQNSACDIVTNLGASISPSFQFNNTMSGAVSDPLRAKVRSPFGDTAGRNPSDSRHSASSSTSRKASPSVVITA